MQEATVRGVALDLENGAYVSFDPDLLRMSAGWTGGVVSMSTMAQVSYDRPNNKSNSVPRVLGQPVFGTGLYPGWSRGDPTFADPRPRPPTPGTGAVLGPLGPRRAVTEEGHLSGRPGSPRARVQKLLAGPPLYAASGA